MLFDRYRNIVAAHGEKVAMEFGDHQISYHKLDEIVNRLANSMRTLGVKKGDAVVIILPNVPHFVFGYLATLALGAVIVPVSSSLSSDKIQQIIDSTDASAIIYWEGYHERICNLMRQFETVVVLGEDVPSYAKKMTTLIAQGATTQVAPELSSADTVLIQHTPGIENSFKSIALSYSSLSFAVKAFVGLADVKESDVFGALLPLTSLLSQVFITGAALTSGAKIVLHPAVNEICMKKSVFEDGVTIMTGGPNVFELLLNTNGDDGNTSLRRAFSTGSRSNDLLMRRFQERFGVPLRNVYGLTEACGIVSACGGDEGVRTGAVGRAVYGLDVMIVNKEGLKQEHNEIGEIVVRGPAVMKGYLNHKDEESIALKNDWLHTGDLGKMDEDGTLFFVDRQDDVIIKGGFHIYPSEVEDLLNAHPKVEKVSVIGQPHPAHKYEVKACVVLRSGENATAEELIEYCREQAPVYKCPQIIKFYNTLPQTNLGKVIKRKLRQDN